MKIYAEVCKLCMHISSLSQVANDFINFVCCLGHGLAWLLKRRRIPFEAFEMKQFTLLLVSAPRVMENFFAFCVLSLFQAFNDHGINVLLTNIARIPDFDTSKRILHYKWITLP